MASITRAVPSFGGMFIDERRQTVYVYLQGPRVRGSRAFASAVSERTITRAMQAIVRRYKNLPLRYVRVLRAEYDFRELNRWHKRAFALFKISGVVSTDIGERRNRIEVGVSSRRARARVVRALRRLQIPRRAVLIRRERAPHPAKTLRDRHYPMMAGMQIRNSARADCTMGPVAYSYAVGRWGFVTNTHCTNRMGTATRPSVEGTLFYQPQPAGGTFGDPGTDAWDAGREMIDPHWPRTNAGGCGTTVFDYSELCRWSDSAFVAWPSWFDAERRGDSGGLWSHGTFAGPLVNSLECNAGGTRSVPGRPEGARWVVGVDYSPVEGRLVEKVGRSTGRTLGKITDTCKASSVVEEDQRQRRCSYYAEYGGAKGDSGSPVYYFVYGDPGSVILAGLNWGGTTDGSKGIFSAISSVEHELGNLYFCRNEVATSSC